MPVLDMSFINIKRKNINKILVIFRLFTNFLRTNLNKKCKNVYVIRIVYKIKRTIKLLKRKIKML